MHNTSYLLATGCVIIIFIIGFVIIFSRDVVNVTRYNNYNFNGLSNIMFYFAEYSLIGNT